MAFEDISKQRGIPRGRGEDVTAAWRIHKSGRPKVAVYVGAAIARRRGWVGDKSILMRVQYDADANLLRLEVAQPGKPEWCAYVKSGTVCFQIPFDHLEGTLLESKPAGAVRFEEDARGITIAMPGWAWQPGKQRARDAADQARGRVAGAASAMAA